MREKLQTETILKIKEKIEKIKELHRVPDFFLASKIGVGYNTLGRLLRDGNKRGYRQSVIRLFQLFIKDYDQAFSKGKADKFMSRM